MAIGTSFWGAPILFILLMVACDGDSNGNDRPTDGDNNDSGAEVLDFSEAMIPTDLAFGTLVTNNDNIVICQRNGPIVAVHLFDSTGKSTKSIELETILSDLNTPPTGSLDRCILTDDGVLFVIYQALEVGIQNMVAFKDGKLVESLGDGGIIKTDIGGFSSSQIEQIVSFDGGYIIGTSGESIQIDASGNLVNDFGEAGHADPSAPIAVIDTDTMVATDNLSLWVLKSGVKSNVTDLQTIGISAIHKTEDSLIAITFTTGGQWSIAHLDHSGTLKESFGTDGTLNLNLKNPQYVDSYCQTDNTCFAIFTVGTEHHLLTITDTIKTATLNTSPIVDVDAIALTRSGAVVLAGEDADGTRYVGFAK